MKWRCDEFTYMTHDMIPNPGPEQDTVYVPGNPGPLIRTFYWWYLKFNSLMIMFLLRSWMDWWWNKSYKIQDSAGSLQLLITHNSLRRKADLRLQAIHPDKDVQAEMYNIDIVQKGVTENAVLRLMFHDCVRYTGGFVSFTTRAGIEPSQFFNFHNHGDWFEKVWFDHL